MNESRKKPDRADYLVEKIFGDKPAHTVQPQEQIDQTDLLMEVAEIASERIYYNKIGLPIPHEQQMIGSITYKDKKIFNESKDKWQFDALGFIRELKEKGYIITKL